MESKLKHTLVVILCLFYTTTIFAQLNIKVGYGISYVNAEVDNQIIKRYNEQFSFLDNPMQEVRFLNGFLVGLRYRIDNFAIEANFENKFNTLESTGIDPISNHNFNRDLLFKYTSYSIGLESYLTEYIGLGVSIDWDHLRYRSETQNADRYNVLKDNGFSSEVHLSLNLQGNDVITLSIQPYVQIPWTKMFIAELENEINPDVAAVIDTNYSADYMNYGVKFIFYNGQW